MVCGGNRGFTVDYRLTLNPATEYMSQKEGRNYIYIFTFPLHVIDQIQVLKQHTEQILTNKFDKQDAGKK